MKHIFKKLHFGSGHDPARASSPPAPPPPSCASDHRRHAGGSVPSPAPAVVTPSPPPSPGDGPAAPPAAAAERPDYYSSEEEFQVQLALAISASNSEFREDPDNDQIRAATLLSLGKQRTDPAGEEEGAAEVLSRRYWDYNVLDYDVKVSDGFYDIFGLSVDPAGHGKMPYLVDLQTNIGDLGFEVIIVNRAIDPALVELEQISHCIALDCPSSEVDLLVQRISDLVAEHMGGPVRDANDMLARWMERSSELRTSLQTSLLAIGSINVGLSRHRALLFKVLADHVGIPCKLVKGSHYTGVDEDAVNMIKLDDREFLVDLMAAPGTLIPADVLSAKDASLKFSNPGTRNQASWTANDSGSAFLWIEACPEDNRRVGKSNPENSGVVGGTLRSESTVVASSFPSASSKELASSSGSSSNEPSTSTGSHKGDSEVSLVSGGVKGKLNNSSHLQDVVDSRNLFAELNPFQVGEVGKYSSQFDKPHETNKNGFQRRRENIMSGPGRPPRPLVWKNRSTCNEVSNKRQQFMEGPLPRKNVQVKDLTTSTSSSSASAERIYTEVTASNVPGISGVSYSPMNCTDGTSVVTAVSSTSEDAQNELNKKLCLTLLSNDGGKTGELVKILSSEKQDQWKDDDQGIVQRNMISGPNEVNNTGDTQDWRKHTHDGVMDFRLLLKDTGSSSIPEQTGTQKLDPMLDDVAECEVLWEDLVIGERIGLGSYGEVHRADWNGTEVAVKKFLDQDFSGDALDEFRREVRIMRRLRHPNVVLFMGAVTRPPNLSIVSEFLPRGSLYRILHRSNCKIDEKRRIKMALDVAKGMNCLHASTPIIVHRDLKSPNLLVDKNWNVKVCDFGLSRLKHNTFLSSKSTAGTPEWMAPEVLRNEPSNEKCDVYSFGVILWELVTLRLPWSGMNPMQVVGAVGFQNRRLDIPKEVDPLVAGIIWECWQTDPSLRPSFADLTSALKPLQQLFVSSHQHSHCPPMPQEIPVNSTP